MPVLGQFCAEVITLVPLPIRKMFLEIYEENIKQISSGSTTHNIFLEILAGRALKLENSGPTSSTFQSMSILVIRCNRRQETVSMPRNSLK